MEQAGECSQYPQSSGEQSGHKDGTAGKPGKLIAEKILRRYVCQGKVHYYVKWKGFSDDGNTWEPEEKLKCPRLVAEFEEKRTQSAQKMMNDAEATRGFNRGLDPDRIVGASVDPSSGELMFRIKWKGCDDIDVVAARVANVRCPEQVLRFYDKGRTGRV